MAGGIELSWLMLRTPALIDDGSLIGGGKPYVSPGHYVKLSVSDTGAGINAELPRADL